MPAVRTGARPTPPADGAGPARPVDGGGRRAAWWPWLLALPIALALAPVLYNRRDPELIGIPFFYWVQIALVLLCGACATAVYLATRRDGDDAPR